MHASVAYNHKLIVDWVPAEDLEDDTFKEVSTDFSTVAAYVSSLLYFTLFQTSDG